MGVPKFYRWISERYPCLSQVIKEHQIPDFDNLYLDMNGIIHACSHPNDDDPHFRISEEKIFRDIFHYLEVLFRIIRPKKLFFMAVDGVAPRAKMNQQRGRRFRTARDAEALQAKAVQKGETLPTEERFDSNCITPGTAFMVRLHEQLKYFVNMKITSDEMWQNMKIVLSGHETPGEGEHKIMDYIRYARSQDDYDPNTRHCLYGLDADLMMLGMCSHEPHFALLREEVKFNRRPQAASKHADPESTTFHLLHLSLLREYIELEFQPIQDKIPFSFDLDMIIDDWVLMGFLVGNDFIPNLPNLHIANDALPTLYNTYMRILPTLDGYLNEGGRLHLRRFEQFMVALAKVDFDKFEEEYEDLKWLESRSEKKHHKGSSAGKGENVLRPLQTFDDFEGENMFGALESAPLEDTDGADESDLPINAELLAMVLRDNPDDEDPEPNDYTLGDRQTKAVCILRDDEFPASWSTMMKFEFLQQKVHYYKGKLDLTEIDESVLRQQAVEYVTAIQWNLNYYYNGVCSWGWYYPQHYAPFLSDIRNFADIEIPFELGRPFLPFEQLLAVLPAASGKLLPEAFRELMTTESSPIIDFYPRDFKSDLNGKKNDWEAVVLIPFIDEVRLLEAMHARKGHLSEQERRRNCHSGPLIFTTAIKPGDTYRSSYPGIFPDVLLNKASCFVADIDGFSLPNSAIRKGILPGVMLDVYFPGFPTLKHLPFKSELRMAEVRVFQMATRKESMILNLTKNALDESDLLTLAERLLGKEVHIGWPHLVPAVVDAVSTEKCRLGMSRVSEQLSSQQVEAFKKECRIVRENYMNARGVEIGKVTTLVYTRPLLGKTYSVTGTSSVILDKQYSQEVQTQALQSIVEQLQVHDPDVQQFSSVSSLFPVNTEVFVLADKCYGCQGTVLEHVDGPFVRISVIVPKEPNIKELLDKQDRIALYYYSAYQLARMLGVSEQFLSRITGTVYMLGTRSDAELQDKEKENGGVGGGLNKLHIGLNLKFNRKNEEVPDYSKKSEDGGWRYSRNVLDILREYLTRFPEVVEFMHTKAAGDDVFYADEVFAKSNASKEKMEELNQWIKALPSWNRQRQTAGTHTVDERMIAAIEHEVEKIAQEKKSQIKLKLKPNLLYRPCLHKGNARPDARADFHLFDRVVNVREGYTVPLGLRGTIVGIHCGNQDADKLLDVVFDAPFLGGVSIRGSNGNGYRVAASAVINLTFGAMLVQKKHDVSSAGNGRESAGRTMRPTSTKPFESTPPGPPFSVPRVRPSRGGQVVAVAAVDSIAERSAFNPRHSSAMPRFPLPPPDPQHRWPTHRPPFGYYGMDANTQRSRSSAGVAAVFQETPSPRHSLAGRPPAPHYVHAHPQERFACFWDSMAMRAPAPPIHAHGASQEFAALLGAMQKNSVSQDGGPMSNGGHRISGSTQMETKQRSPPASREKAQFDLERFMSSAGKHAQKEHSPASRAAPPHGGWSRKVQNAPIDYLSGIQSSQPSDPHVKQRMHGKTSNGQEPQVPEAVNQLFQTFAKVPQPQTMKYEQVEHTKPARIISQDSSVSPRVNNDDGRAAKIVTEEHLKDLLSLGSRNSNARRNAGSSVKNTYPPNFTPGRNEFRLNQLCAQHAWSLPEFAHKVGTDGSFIVQVQVKSIKFTSPSLEDICVARETVCEIALKNLDAPPDSGGVSRLNAAAQKGANRWGDPQLAHAQQKQLLRDELKNTPSHKVFMPGQVERKRVHSTSQPSASTAVAHTTSASKASIDNQHVDGSVRSANEGKDGMNVNNGRDAPPADGDKKKKKSPRKSRLAIKLPTEDI